MSQNIPYTFTGTPWKYEGQGGWIFISLPKPMSKEIRNLLQWQEEGWGRLKARARIGNSSWDTAIWFDTKQDTYLLPLKATIRTREKIVPGTAIDVTIWV